MSSSIPNERILRIITIATLLPAFPILIASGVMSDRSDRYNYWKRFHARPTIIYFGLIPTFFSAITSTLFIKTTEDPFDKRPNWRAGLWFLIDFFLAAANLSILIPVWIFEPFTMYDHTNWMMLETFIHAYLAFYLPIKKIFKGYHLFAFQTECPHCHGKLRAVETVGRKTGEGYSLLRAEDYLDEEPEAEASTGIIRESTDSQV
ncbi:hypothetical protein N0V90_001441 [Kalmusia sp. IMI 367209]|nr:hypothetical protein N0V90_001441 [Kalmusia sp. IMI 367209]